MKIGYLMPVLVVYHVSQVNGECEDMQCKGGACQNGICMHGCEDGYFELDCTNKCSTGCVHNRCNGTEEGIGMCTDGCISGYWGDTCSSECPSACKTCIQKTGKVCTSCPEFRNGTTCEGNCRSSCPSTGCNMDGICKNDSLACRNGKFGANCHLGCSKGCLYDTCTKTSGICLHGCKRGYFGDKCESSCSSNCKKQICNIRGKCTEGCDTGYYGDDCEWQCPVSCRQALCDRDTSDCTNGCSDGYYGTHCNEICLSDCAVCHGITGECLEIFTTSTEKRSENNLTGYYVLGPVFLCGIIVIVIIVKRYCRSSARNLREDKNNTRRLPDPPMSLYQYEYNDINEDEMDPSNQQLNIVTSDVDRSIPLSLHADSKMRDSNSPQRISQSEVDSQSDCREEVQIERDECQGAQGLTPMREVVFDNSLYRGYSKVSKECSRREENINKKYLSVFGSERDVHSF